MTYSKAAVGAASKEVFNTLRRQASMLGRQHCTLCLDHTKHLHYALCPSCNHDLPRLLSACSQCALPLPSAQLFSSSARFSKSIRKETLCGHCLIHPPSFDHCYAALEYRSPVDQLVSQLKYKRQFAHAHLLAALMVEHLMCYREAVPWPDLMMPVPLHWSRRLSRGFNQCNLLADHIDTQLRTQLGYRCISTNSLLAKRVVRTRSQAGQNKKQRQQNMQGVFAVRPAVSGKTVAIIDDVVTTGATANELAAQLKLAGAERVEVWCAARTPVPG